MLPIVRFCSKSVSSKVARTRCSFLLVPTTETSHNSSRAPVAWASFHTTTPAMPLADTVVVTMEHGSISNTTKDGNVAAQSTLTSTDAASSACGTESNDSDNQELKVDDDEEEEDEQEEMFVEPHIDFAFRSKEWGGPRRGGRLLEPTRFGDWERKGRCSDF
jgi:hypothetical protein